MLEVDGGRALRVVDPVANRSECFACHESEHRINGLVVVDMELEPALASLRTTIGDLALVSSLAGLLILVGAGFLFRRMMMRRLMRFERTAVAIARGDLSSRLEVSGDDRLGRVERCFNEMADSVSSLIDRSRRQQDELERVMNSVDDGMAVLDRNRTVVAANDAFVRRFRGSRVETLGHPCHCGLSDSSCVVSSDEHGPCPTQACFLSGRVQTVLKRRVAAGRRRTLRGGAGLSRDHRRGRGEPCRGGLA